MFLNQSDLLAEISDRTGYTRKELKFIFDVFKDLMYDHMRKNDTVRIFNGLTFKGERREGRKLKNPQTNTFFIAEPFTRIKVIIGRVFRDYVR